MEILEAENVEVYIYQCAKSGNMESGDAYFVHLEEDYFILAIADGLGNGPIARQSADIIPTILKEHHNESIDELLFRCNECMLRKRGAAVAIVKVDFNQKTIQYSCVGNVRFYILHDGDKMIYPLPVMGYLSGKPQRFNTQEYPYKKGDLFFLHSDGIVLRSPKSFLMESSCTLGLFRKAVNSIKHNDDATFIAGSLLH